MRTSDTSARASGGPASPSANPATAATQIFMPVPRGNPPSLRLYLRAGELDHLAPLLDLRGNHPAKFGRRAGQRRAAKLRNARRCLRICESGVELLVDLVDDFTWRAARRPDAEPGARLIAG